MSLPPTETTRSSRSLGSSSTFKGASPITDFLGGELELDPAGCLRVDGDLQTSVPGVFAAGDVLCKHLKQAVITAAEGARAAVAAERYLAGRESLRSDWS